MGIKPERKRWIDKADRSADVFEFLAAEGRLHRSFIVRAKNNRCIEMSHEDGEANKLFEYIRSVEANKATRKKTTYDEKLEKVREAILNISFSEVTLMVPKEKRGEYANEPLRVWAVRVWEANPPSGGEALEWMLLTNEEVTTVSEAWQKSDWYGKRNMVEEYHKCQKTGCRIEELQMETTQSLQPMIAMLSVVAVMLL